MSLKTSAFAVTSLKRANQSDGITLRGYNLGHHAETLAVNYHDEQPQAVNFFEEAMPATPVDALAPNEIKTLLFKDSEAK